MTLSHAALAFCLWLPYTGEGTKHIILRAESGNTLFFNKK